MEPPERDRIIRVSDRLRDAGARLRVLNHLAWPASVRREFLSSAGSRLPSVSYRTFDPAPTVAALQEARREIRSDGVVDAWLARTADEIETAVRMLAVVGRPALHQHSVALYGRPEHLFPTRRSPRSTSPTRYTRCWVGSPSSRSV